MSDLDVLWLAAADGDPQGVDVMGTDIQPLLLPHAGPTVYCLARALVRWLDVVGIGAVSVTQLAKDLGVPAGKVRPTLKRAHHFRLIKWEPESATVTVVRRWQPVGVVR